MYGPCQNHAKLLIGAFLTTILFDMSCQLNSCFLAENAISLPRTLTEFGIVAVLFVDVRCHCCITVGTNEHEFFRWCRGCPHYERRLLKYVNRGFSIVDLEMNRTAIESHPFILKEPARDSKFSFNYEGYDDEQGGGKNPGMLQ
jgi:hypothetical protein